MRQYNPVAVVNNIELQVQNNPNNVVTIYDKRGVPEGWTLNEPGDQLSPSQKLIHHYNINDASRFPFLYRVAHIRNTAGTKPVVYLMDRGIGRVMYLETIQGVETLCTDQDYMRFDDLARIEPVAVAI